MLPLSFVRPEYLWLLLVLPFTWALIWFNRNSRDNRRRWTATALRTLLLLALITSLAGAQWVQPVRTLTTVFLLDSSDSISPAQRSGGEQYIAEALKTMQSGDKAAIVVFGQNALVERIPSDTRRLGAIQSVPVATRTNLSEALQLGLALFPADTQKRLVLLSDGGENIGQALDQLPLAARRQTPIDIVPVGAGVKGAELAVVDFQSPSGARKGQEVQLVATIESTSAQSARLRWLADTQLLLEESVQVPEGTSTYTTTVIVGEQGFHRYQLQVVPEGEDTRPQNNVAGNLVDVIGEPKILLVEGEPGDATMLKNALQAAKLEPEVVAPAGIPTQLAGMVDYEAIVLVNVPANAISPEVQTLIKSYVGDLGRGLAMIGGTKSFGTGGYTSTPIEEALPVSMDVRSKQQRPDIAIVFVIDKSGSMDACHCNGGDMAARQEGGTKKIDIAKEAVAEAATLLSPQDKLGVITFDDIAHWTIDIQQPPSLGEVEKALAPIKPNGSTNVVSGMQAALDRLKQTDAKIKHVILLTDGWGRTEISSIVKEMRDSGITLSTIAAGNGSDNSLERYADIGGGRYYPARTMEEVPQIFLEETMQAVGTYIVEEQFTPAYAASTPILAGLEAGLPQLLGYNGVVQKDTAQVDLVAPDGSPVLAQWQFGLGRAVAWTSDMKGKWASSWVGWEEFPRFAAQLVGWMLPRLNSESVTGSSHAVDTDTVLTVNANDLNGQPISGATVMGRAALDSGEAVDVTFTEVGPGVYQGRLENPLPGTYLVQVTGNDASGKPIFARTIGAVVAYSAEYRQGESNPQLLNALAEKSGGRVLSAPPQAFEHTLEAVRSALPIELLLLLLALLLLPLDIAARRLSLRWADLAVLQAQRRARRTVAAAPGSTLDELQAAKGRARARTTSSAGQAPPPARAPGSNTPAYRPGATTPTPALKPAEPPPDPWPTSEASGPGASKDSSDPFDRLKAAKDRARRR